MSESSQYILLLSGPLAVGKSTVAAELVLHWDFVNVSSGGYLLPYAAARGLPTDRKGLQALGDYLDEQSDYSWPIEEVAAPAITAAPGTHRWLIEAVRKPRQVQHFRARFDVSVRHVHLNAFEETLRARYETRLKAGDDYSGGTPYDAAIQHPNEVASRSLQHLADLVMDLDSQSAVSAAKEIVRWLIGP